MPRNGRPSRFKPRAYKRWRAARTIGRAWRRRRRPRTYRSKSQKTSNVRLGKRRGRTTLLKRVARLEISSKKHYDYVLSRATGQPIQPYGVEDGSVTNESFSQMLAIQPVHLDGTIPPQSGSARGTERNTREGEEIFCTKVRLRGRILGIRANDEPGIENCLQTINVGGGVTVALGANDRQTYMQATCQSRCHLLVLADRRPSTINPVTGKYEPNPLPVQPMNPIQGLFQLEGLGAVNTLATLGMDSALKNYTNNRFKVVHKSTLQFDFLHPSKWFDISIAVNKKLVYEPKDPAVPAPGNTDPVNYNLLFYVSSVPSELAAAASPYMIMTEYPLAVPPVEHNLLRAPNLMMLSSRTYFRES